MNVARQDRQATLLSKHQLVAFFALTFAISWAIWTAMILSSMTIATPTGEGVTNPMTFTRSRRMSVAGSLRIV